jgi:hypothetical protein
MENIQPSYIVYNPPIEGFPFLSVILAPDGTATARPFDTVEEAAVFSARMAVARHPGNIRN